MSVNPGNLKASLISLGFTGDLVIPSDETYAASLVRFAKNAQRNAALVAFVKSAADVSLAIKVATSEDVPLTVRGGGHSTAGASSIENGVVIDLSRYLTSVRVDEEKKLGYVGGGANWAAVDAEAIKFGLATVGGTINHTGVGGLSLGGGFGWLTGDHSMTIDNMVEVTIVTADGEVRTANADTNEDLFWGVRGGGGNFGCVVEFVYQLHPQRRTVFAGPLVFPPTKLHQVVGAIETWYSTSDPRESMMLANSTKGQNGEAAVVVILFFNGEEDEGRQRFKGIIDIGPIADMATTIPYEQLNSLQNGHMRYGINGILSSVSRGCLPPPTADLILKTLIKTANDPSEVCPGIGMAVLWEFHNLKKQTSIPADATAFCMRYPIPAATLVITWDDAADPVTAAAEARRRLKEMKKRADELLKETFIGRVESKDDTGYGNYEPSNSASTGAASALFGANYPKLQALKKQYDPNLVFRSWYPIQPM